MRSMPLMVYLVGATLLQALHACLIFLIRPFSQIKDNIIEVANELTLTTLMALIIFFNDESAWSKTPILIFLYFHYLLNHIGISYCSPLSLFCSFRSVSPEHLNPYAHFYCFRRLRDQSYKVRPLQKQWKKCNRIKKGNISCK
jgi:hypothetical protein